MKKRFLKIAVMGAACSMLAVSVRAQADSQGQAASNAPAPRSWSTKHLSATGRDNNHAVRATELNGAPVNDSAGQRIATLEDTIINPATGRVEFALLSLNGGAAGSNSNSSSSSPGKWVPVPWSLMKTGAASSQYATSSEKPTFTLNVEQSKLNSAPTIQSSDLSQSEWQQRIYSYYGVTPSPSSMGAAESPSGEIKGEGAKPTPQHQLIPMP